MKTTEQKLCKALAKKTAKVLLERTAEHYSESLMDGLRRISPTGFEEKLVLYIYFQLLIEGFPHTRLIKLLRVYIQMKLTIFVEMGGDLSAIDEDVFVFIHTNVLLLEFVFLNNSVHHLDTAA